MRTEAAGAVLWLVAASVVVLGLVGGAAAGARSGAGPTVLGQARPATPGPSGIPLCAGLTVVSAVSEAKGDYESILKVESTSPQAIDLMFSTQVSTSAGTTRLVRKTRRVLRQDLASARLVVGWFHTDAPDTIPDSTALVVSRDVFRALKGAGRADLGLIDRDSSGLPADRTRQPNLYEAQTVYPLRRVGDQPTPFSALVNDLPRNLPALRARGDGLGEAVEFDILDDESNPVVLAYRRYEGPASARPLVEESRVVKIGSACTAARATETSPLERALIETGRADVYTIYFGFNSADLREESDATVRLIADILRRHPDWSLAIEGHTDSIAGDAFNLTLSERRATAVREALTSRHGVAAARLATSGYGESQPKDRNDTLEGRARNRRVELVRR